MMPQTDAFSRFHPLVNFLYFALTITFSLALRHPLCQLLSLLCALGYLLLLEGRAGLASALRLALPLSLFSALANPIFSHIGVTVLCYLPGGNPLTAESILYGLSSGVMLCTVLLWFRSFSRVITSDKFVYLFGRVIPSLSLVLSMALRFVPLFRLRLHQVVESQRGLGRDISRGSLRHRLRSVASVLSILITWSLENAIDTADSMKSRGYGHKGRTAFSPYRFTHRDLTALLWLLCLGTLLTVGAVAGQLSWQYYPYITGAAAQTASLLLYLLYAALCLTPIIIRGKERVQWHYFISNI